MYHKFGSFIPYLSFIRIFLSVIFLRVNPAVFSVFF